MPKLSRILRLSAFAISNAALVAACVSSGASPDAGSASPSTGPSPTVSPPTAGISHATGATDVLLRYEVGGGFVPFGYFVTQAPSFTLYGDGTVIFRDETATPPPAVGQIVRAVPFSTIGLDEAKVQELLAFALDEGGLREARDSYPYDLVADAPSSVFEIHADGVDRTVSVYALGIDGPDIPDASARQSFAVLAEVLRTFDTSGAPVTLYEPERYRGVLMEPWEEADTTGAIDWPWQDLTPADFTGSGQPDGIGYSSYTLSAAQVEALRLEGLGGGAQGIVLRDPDDVTFHLLALRPLFPDEAH